MVIYGIQRVHLAIIALEVFRVAKRKQHQIGKHMIGRHIVADPTICHGQILVADVMEQVAAGIAWETILEEWRGNVSSEAISEAVRLARQAFSDHSAQYTECRLPRGIRPIRSQTYFSNFLRPTRISCPRVRTPVSANSRRTVPYDGGVRNAQASGRIFVGKTLHDTAQDRAFPFREMHWMGAGSEHEFAMHFLDPAPPRRRRAGSRKATARSNCSLGLHRGRLGEGEKQLVPPPKPRLRSERGNPTHDP
jgi:uncharacterized protein (DUF433 family)